MILVKTVIVLGMHRSGTSVVMSILKSLGVDIGKRESSLGQFDNPLGHFENLDFTDFNVELLRAAGGDWINPPSIEEITQAVKPMHARITQLVEENMGPLWGFKDPRTALTIHVLRPYLPNLHVIHTTRNSQAIANSIHKRDGIPHSYSMALCNIYNERINSFLIQNKVPSIKVNYNNLLALPSVVIQKIIDFLHIFPSQPQFKEAVARVRPDQRHWR